jgi:DNA helicase II / ATP-dependent DNA helicase PcrA
LAVTGPGKTRVIIERIMYLVNSGIKPSEILCLTFTKKTTKEMSQRLENHDITFAYG